MSKRSADEENGPLQKTSKAGSNVVNGHSERESAAMPSKVPLCWPPMSEHQMKGSNCSEVSSSSAGGNTDPAKITSSPAETPSVDREYFDSYGDLEVHRTMIEDSVRTQAYRRAILTNYQLFYGKTVLDVGCGTGILSVFCCQAGARRVYAVEASSSYRYAQQVAAENGYGDRIEVLACRMEEAQLPEKVDIIVSEWMGYALLYESMLDSVLLARDRWLKPGGALFPDKAEIFTALTTCPDVSQEDCQFWDSVESRYKVKMACLSAVSSREAQRRAWVSAVLPEEVHSLPTRVASLDLLAVSPEAVSRVCADSLRLVSFGSDAVSGLVLWFDVSFPGGVKLTTSPYCEETHWAQTVLLLPRFRVHQDSEVEVKLEMCQNRKQKRYWDFAVQLKYAGETSSHHYTLDHGS